MGDEGVDLDERTGIEEQLDPLARGELARLVLAADPLLPAALGDAVEPLLEIAESGLIGRASCRERVSSVV